MKLLLFAGTSEGRELAERLAGLPVVATVCVATDYGRETLGGLPERLTVRVGRLDAEAMRAMLRQGCYDAVIDATHPYAVAASDNARTAAEGESIPYFRLTRAASWDYGCAYYPTVAAAAAALAGTEGNILAATGTKDLDAYAVVPDYARRLYPRVLPTEEALRRCRELGIPGGHIIAMQGPFGLELNRAIMVRFAIKVMVTKDGGEAGGFPEKMEAAAALGVATLVVGRPLEGDGCAMDEVLSYIRDHMEAES